MTFDNFGRLTKSRQVTDGVIYGTDASPMTYSCNLSGALIEEKYPSGRIVKNEFESDGDLLNVTHYWAMTRAHARAFMLSLAYASFCVEL